MLLQFAYSSTIYQNPSAFALFRSPGLKSYKFFLLQLARKHNVLLHSDACLGGFVLPFARKLGYQIPAFDFSVPGVTSMSVDTHKFGMAHKGTSVVLYRSAAIRRHQYTQITEWTGGLYISPGMVKSFKIRGYIFTFTSVGKSIL